MYGLESEFCALSEHGLRNFVSVWFESSEGIFERPKKLVWTGNFFIVCNILTIVIQN